MSRFLSTGIHVVDTVVSWWFQTTCCLCGRSSGSETLCEECVRSFALVGGPRCNTCGVNTTQPILRCGECEIASPPWEMARSLLWLNDSGKALIHFVKYGSRVSLLRWFHPLVLGFDFSEYPKNLTVVPVPMHWKRWVERGFNQSEILADWIAQKNRWEFSDGLKKVAKTPAQSSLSRRQRQKNLNRVFSWKGTLVPKQVLLVDDVLTTGATLRSCSAALKKAGCEKIWVWTLFRAPGWNSSPALAEIGRVAREGTLPESG